MKIAGISGSPRAKGNTDILVQEALEAASELGAKTELIALSGKKNKPCNCCGTCCTPEKREPVVFWLQ